MYPATYNFKDETDGTSGTDIEGITLNQCDTCVIVSDYLGHRKALHFVDSDVGQILFTAHTETSGTFEFWGNNPTANDWYFRHRDNDNNFPIAIYIQHKTNMQILFGNGAGGTDFVNVAIAEDEWFHIRVQFDCGTNKQSVWVNGVLKVDNENFDDDDTPDNLTYIQIYNDGACEGYIDALGYSWDTDYNVGDNLYPDMHDPYNKIQITDIVQYPIITPTLDKYYIGALVVRDFEGAMFAYWNDRDFNKILIEDNSGNIMFRGFLMKKVFNAQSMTLTIAGIGVLLDWEAFGSEGVVNYILAEGLVNVPIEGTSILTLQTLASAPFTWDANWWVSEGRHVGILIVDKTAVNTRSWDSSAISQVGGAVIAGNNASTLTFNDLDYYNVRDTSSPNLDLNITPVIDGTAVDDTDFLKSIQIEYSFRLKISVGATWIKATIYLQILKDTTWETIATLYGEKYGGSYISDWQTGIPLDVDGGNGNQFVIEDTDAELQKYFNKTGATYTSLKGMRFALRGQGDISGSAEIHVDYVKVKPGYTSYDVAPIMETITDSAPSTVTCESVPAWDETGVVEDDGFKIGQNTRVIVRDIASESGLNIDIIDPHDEVAESNIVVDPDSSVASNWLQTGNPPNHAKLIDETDETNINCINGQENQIDEYTMDTFNMGNTYIHKIIVHLRGEDDVGVSATGVSLYINGAWTDYKDVDFTTEVTWVHQPWEDLNINQENLNALKIRLKSPATIPFGQTVYIYEMELHVYEKFPNFNKYMARKFKGAFCMEALKAVCELEGTHWYEDYINNKIVMLRLSDFVDSTVDLTQADYEDTWEFTDDCNQVKSVFVFGKSEDEIFAKAVDESVAGYASKQLIDESITNVADAQEIADAELAKLKTKRPSIRLPLHVDNVLLQLGTTVGVTLARPTIAEADYPIRMIERKKVGIIIKTIIYCGMGESPWDEELARTIRDNAERSHKSLTDRLISP